MHICGFKKGTEYTRYTVKSLRWTVDFNLFIVPYLTINNICAAVLIMCDIYIDTSTCFVLTVSGSMTMSQSTLAKMTEGAVLGDFSSRWQQAASSLQLHINGVISEHSRALIRWDKPHLRRAAD